MKSIESSGNSYHSVTKWLYAITVLSILCSNGEQGKRAFMELNV